MRRLLPAPIIEEPHSGRCGNYTVYLCEEAVVHAAEQTEDWIHTQDRRQRAANPRKLVREVDLFDRYFHRQSGSTRQRDLAECYYMRSMHGFAGSSKRKKHKYYDLKDRGITAAHQAERLNCTFRHAGRYLCQGEGYSFHSTLKPKALEIPELALPPGKEHLFIDAKPRRTSEPRLQDTVKKLPVCRSRGGNRYQPVRPRAPAGVGASASGPHLLELW